MLRDAADVKRVCTGSKTNLTKPQDENPAMSVYRNILFFPQIPEL